MPKTSTSPQREQLLAILRETPWLTVGDLLHRSGLAWGTLHYHLTILLKSGAVRATREGRRRILVAAATTPYPHLRREAILRGKTTREIARVVATHPGRSIDDVIAATGRTPRVVYYHVKRLIETDLVVSSSATRHRGLSATPVLLQLLRQEHHGL